MSNDDPKREQGNNIKVWEDNTTQKRHNTISSYLGTLKRAFCSCSLLQILGT